MIRYIKRFTGTQKKVQVATVLQQQIHGIWTDVLKEDAEWETPEDAQKYKQARDYEGFYSIFQ